MKKSMDVVKASDSNAVKIGGDQISSLADKFKKVVSLNDSNENLIDIVSLLGGSIKYDDPIHWENDQTASLIVRDNRFEIIASKYLSEDERNYAIAHEFGHYILHSDFGKHNLEFSLFGDGLIEAEADHFAYNLLLPEEHFKEICAKFNNVIIGISVYFNVPDYIVKNRLGSLGI